MTTELAGQFRGCADEPVLERKYSGHAFKLYLEVSHVSISEERLGTSSQLIHWLKHVELAGHKGQESSVRFTGNAVEMVPEKWLLEEGAKGKACSIRRLGILTP